MNMAAIDPPRQLSLVPYASDSREVVLRHGNSVVVYDPQSRLISLRKDSHTFDGANECPMCHRPLHDTTPLYEDDERAAPQDDDRTFVNPDYFRMLAQSIPPSPNPSRSSSPLKRLPASHDRNVRGASEQSLPLDAEFLGSAPAPQAADPGIRTSSFNPNYFKSFFVEKRELGRGGRGVVLLVEHRINGVFLGEYAAKRIPVGNDHTWLEKVLVEVQLLQQLIHPNLVSYRHVWLENAIVTNFGPSVPCVFILQQYCNGGDLHDYMLKSLRTSLQAEDLKEQLRRRKSKGHSDSVPNLQSPRKMQFEEIFSFFRDITSGLHHLHTNGYIHRDLKPSNCLLSRSGQKLTVHVSDFGEVQATSAKRSSTGATGTISYCAPEVLKRETAGGEFGNFTTKSDIFSLGMIVYFMCFGHLPYASADELNEENEDIDELRAEVSRWNGFDESIRSRADLPERLYRFLKQLLSPDPSKRPSTGQILQAIQGGGDPDSPGFQSPELGETSPRITSVDTPTRRRSMTQNRRPSTGVIPRPGLGSLGRHRSSGEVIHSKKPIQETVDETTPTQDKAGVMVRGSKPIGTPTLHEPVEHAPQSARLIMPPPTTIQDQLMKGLHHPANILAFKALAFSFKLATVSWPCSPYAVSPLAFYPLMILSMVDILLHLGLLESFILLGLHILIWSTAMRSGTLCSRGSSISWEAT